MSDISLSVGTTEQRVIDSLKPYEGNPRNHDKTIPELVKSIKEKGFYSPIIIDQNDRIVCGHGRYKAAKEVGMTIIPVLVMELSDDEYLNTMISDNKIAELSKYNRKTLKVCLEMLDGLNTPPIGFSESEVAKVFGHKDKFENNLDDEANFGDSGKVKIESEEQNAGVIKRKIFQFTPKEHEDVTAKLKAYIKENDLDNESQAIINILKSFKRKPRTIKAKGPVKVISSKE